MKGIKKILFLFSLVLLFSCSFTSTSQAKNTKTKS